MSWTAAQLDAALADARALVRSDGADLELVEASPGAARIVLRLELGTADCATGSCVMPGAVLQPLIAEAIARHLPEELELRIIDPRRA